MSDRLVEVAAFHTLVKAHAAHGLLEAEGIHAVIAGDQTAGIFGGVQGVVKITLHVAESDAERAVGILATAEADRESDDGPRDEDAFWLCPLCGDAVADDWSVCPACETPRPPERKSEAVVPAAPRDSTSQEIQQEPPPEPVQVTADAPVEAVPSAGEDDLDIPDPETFLGDDLVRRAFFSAWFGVLVPYSLWLLGRLAFYPGKISPRMMPRLYGAIVIDALWCLLLVLLFCRGILPP